MRRTVSSVGPDIGDTIDIGKVVASKGAATLDIVANSLMKNAYDYLGDPKPGARPNDDLVNRHHQVRASIRDGDFAHALLLEPLRDPLAKIALKNERLVFEHAAATHR